MHSIAKAREKVFQMFGSEGLQAFDEPASSSTHRWWAAISLLRWSPMLRPAGRMAQIPALSPYPPRAAVRPLRSTHQPAITTARFTSTATNMTDLNMRDEEISQV